MSIGDYAEYSEGTLSYEENAEANSASYCECCGRMIDNSEQVKDINDIITPTEAIYKLAELYAKHPVAVEIILARVIRPELNADGISKAIRRDPKTVRENSRAVSQLLPDLSRLLLREDTKARAQTERRAREAVTQAMQEQAQDEASDMAWMSGGA